VHARYGEHRIIDLSSTNFMNNGHGNVRRGIRVLRRLVTVSAVVLGAGLVVTVFRTPGPASTPSASGLTPAC
jgi:hypothetical protein